MEEELTKGKRRELNTRIGIVNFHLGKELCVVLKYKVGANSDTILGNGLYGCSN